MKSEKKNEKTNLVRKYFCCGSIFHESPSLSSLKPAALRSFALSSTAKNKIISQRVSNNEIYASNFRY